MKAFKQMPLKGKATVSRPMSKTTRPKKPVGYTPAMVSKSLSGVAKGISDGALTMPDAVDPVAWRKSFDF